MAAKLVVRFVIHTTESVETSIEGWCNDLACES